MFKYVHTQGSSHSQVPINILRQVNLPVRSNFGSCWVESNSGVRQAETTSTIIESKALELILDLLLLPRADFPMRTITTGATASNVLGLGA